MAVEVCERCERERPTKCYCGAKWAEMIPAPREASVPLSEYEQIAQVLCIRAGCQCAKPLLGWTSHHTPRCRACGVEVVEASVPVEALRALAEKWRAPVGVPGLHIAEDEARRQCADDLLALLARPEGEPR